MKIWNENKDSKEFTYVKKIMFQELSREFDRCDDTVDFDKREIAQKKWMH